MPMSITATIEKIYDAFLSDDRAKTFFHGHSFTANPLGCAVAIESLNIFRDENVLDRVTALGKIIETRLETLKSLPHIGDVRIIGGVGIIELGQDKTTKTAGGYLGLV